MVRELFEMARFANLLIIRTFGAPTLNLISPFRTKKACLIFFDEIDAVGGARFDDGAGGDNEV